MTLALPWCYLGIILAFHGVTLALPWCYPLAQLCTVVHTDACATSHNERKDEAWAISHNGKMRHVLSATLGTNEAWAISHNCKKLGMGYQPQLGTMRHGLSATTGKYEA